MTNFVFLNTNPYSSINGVGISITSSLPISLINAPPTPLCRRSVNKEFLSVPVAINCPPLNTTKVPGSKLENCPDVCASWYALKFILTGKRALCSGKFILYCAFIIKCFDTPNYTTIQSIISKSLIHALWVWNYFSLKIDTRENEAKQFSLEFLICEPSGFRVEHLLDSIIKTYYKLQELGFTYQNGKITVVEVEEAENVT